MTIRENSLIPESSLAYQLLYGFIPADPVAPSPFSNDGVCLVSAGTARNAGTDVILHAVAL